MSVLSNIYTSGAVCKKITFSGGFKPLTWGNIVFTKLRSETSSHVPDPHPKGIKIAFWIFSLLKKLHDFYDIISLVQKMLEDLNKKYDKLQKVYGDPNLDSIYNGGCTNNPDICFVFMNPTGKNIDHQKKHIHINK